MQVFIQCDFVILYQGGNDDLFCSVCNLYFNSFYNKREYMFGKKYFVVIFLQMDRFEKRVEKINGKDVLELKKVEEFFEL